MSNEESFEIFEERPDHAYRTEIPNIVFELDLDLHEFKLYCFYKKVAGDRGCCTMCQNTIHKKTGISADKQKKCNEKFRRPFDLLGGKSLIRFYQTRKQEGGKGANQILIVDIWKENGKFYRDKTKEKCPKDDVSAIPLPAGTLPAPSGIKKNLIKKNRPVCPSSATQSYSPPECKLTKKLKSLMKERKVSTKKINEAFDYPLSEVELAMKYSILHEKKKEEEGEVTRSFGTYLLLCLQHRWYESESFDPDCVRFNLDKVDGKY